MTHSHRILFCRCAHADAVPAGTKAAVQTFLDAGGLVVESVDDLCGLAARRDPALKRWAQIDGLTVVACYPRAVTWLFAFGGAAVQGREVRFLNMRTQTPEAIIQALRAAGEAPKKTADDTSTKAADDAPMKAACDAPMKAACDAPTKAACGCRQKAEAPVSAGDDPALRLDADWLPWFPVIDYDACTNCKQCLNFCLFDVFRLNDDARVEVIHPANCKTYCPACARVCPQQAIIFPKYKPGVLSGDALGGAGTCPCGKEATDMLADLLTGDIYAGLKARDKPAGRRFSTDPKTVNTQAAQRQCGCLSNLTDKLDIPLSVLQNLSPQEVARLSAQSNVDAADSASSDADGCACDCDCAAPCDSPSEKDAPSDDPDASTGRCSCC